MKKQKCPQCGVLNDDNWPISVDGVIKQGGCQECWEAYSDREWWREIEKLAEAGLLPTTAKG